MNNDGAPGLGNQSGVRTTARIVAVVLLVVGVVLLVKGISAFVSELDDPMASDGPGSLLMAGAGGFCIVLGLAATNVGWLRAQASYVAGETMPVVKQSLDHLQAGPYCRTCGTRNDSEATFCDTCGTSLA